MLARLFQWLVPMGMIKRKRGGKKWGLPTGWGASPQFRQSPSYFSSSLPLSQHHKKHTTISSIRQRQLLPISLQPIFFTHSGQPFHYVPTSTGQGGEEWLTYSTKHLGTSTKFRKGNLLEKGRGCRKAVSSWSISTIPLYQPFPKPSTNSNTRQQYPTLPAIPINNIQR